MTYVEKGHLFKKLIYLLISFKWNGIYFLSLSSNNFSHVSKKITVLLLFFMLCTTVKEEKKSFYSWAEWKRTRKKKKNNKEFCAMQRDVRRQWHVWNRQERFCWRCLWNKWWNINTCLCRCTTLSMFKLWSELQHRIFSTEKSKLKKLS